MRLLAITVVVLSAGLVGRLNRDGGARAAALRWSAPSTAGSVVGLSTRADGPRVRRLSPGLYRIQVKAVSDMPFHLYGPGVDRKTKLEPDRDGLWQTRPRYTFFVTWKVRLKKGRYVYRAGGYWGRVSRMGGLRASGSFVVR
jgi:hypothetical protein